MKQEEQIKDNILGMDITMNPHTPYKNCYAFHIQFQEEFSTYADIEKPHFTIFETHPDKTSLLQTVLELEIYRANTDLFTPSESIFRTSYGKYNDNYWTWLEQHPNFSKKPWDAHTCAVIDSYSIFYHNEEGNAYSVDFKLSPKLKKEIHTFYDSEPKSISSREAFNDLRQTFVIFLEQQLLLSHIETKNITPKKSLKI